MALSVSDSIPFPLIESLDGTAYIVDASGRIVSYGTKNWSSFANNNEAPELCEPDNVIGTKLLDVVQGDDVREVYGELMAKILSGGADGFAFGFRCDAPDIAREMRMAMTAVLDADRSNIAGVLFQSCVLQSEMRPPMDIFRFRSLAALVGSDPNLPIVTVCSYCQNISLGDLGKRDGEWVSAEEYYRRGGSSKVQLSHGACKSCYSEILGH